MKCANCSKKNKGCPGIPKCKCKACLKSRGSAIDIAPKSNKKSSVAAVSKPKNKAIPSKDGLPFSELKGKEISLLAKEDVANLSSLHGAVEKFSMNHDGIEYMIKPSPEHYFQNHAEIENVCSKIARILGFDVPNSGVAKINGEKSFVQENFISKSKEPCTLVHIYRYLHDAKAYDVQSIIKATEKATKDKNSAKHILRMIIFDCLIGNTDRHGRNIALILTKKGAKLSPMYDNMCFILPGRFGLKNTFAGKIGTKNKENPTTKDYMKELSRLGLGSDRASFVAIVRKNLALIVSAIDSSELSLPQKIDFKKHLNESLEIMCEK